MGKGLLAKAGRIQVPAVKRPLEEAPHVEPEMPAAGADDAHGQSPRESSERKSTSAASTDSEERSVERDSISARVAGAAAAKPRTAPGTLMGFMATQSQAIKENERLREQVAGFEGAKPARLIAADRIRPSRWANRHASAFEREEFATLKKEIAQAGGNVQAIKVRPLRAQDAAVASSEDSPVTSPNAPNAAGVGPSHPHPTAQREGGRTVPPPTVPLYEIVFGHRRHRACLELGLPVLAVVEEASEQELFVQMERENRNRTDLSVWEQGVMYARALDAGLYASNRQLALAIGRDLSDVGKALAVARLPQAVIEAFASPLDLQFRWAKPLSDAQQRDPDLLLERALALRAAKLPAKEVFDALVGVTGKASQSPRSLSVERNGQVAAMIQISAAGLVTIRIQQPMDAAQVERLADALKKLI